jgi:hypothetical protein
MSYDEYMNYRREKEIPRGSTEEEFAEQQKAWMVHLQAMEERGDDD